LIFNYLYYNNLYIFSYIDIRIWYTVTTVPVFGDRPPVTGRDRPGQCNGSPLERGRGVFPEQCIVGSMAYKHTPATSQSYAPPLERGILFFHCHTLSRLSRTGSLLQSETSRTVRQSSIIDNIYYCKNCRFG